MLCSICTRVVLAAAGAAVLAGFLVDAGVAVLVRLVFVVIGMLRDWVLVVPQQRYQYRSLSSR
jgi:hypothetical protein